MSKVSKKMTGDGNGRREDKFLDVEENLEGGESAAKEPIEDCHVLKATLLYF
jgi:hypothetical protein